MSFGVGIGDIIKLCDIAGRVYKNCRDCTGEYKSLTSDARQLTNLLEDIQDKFNKIPKTKLSQFQDAYESCIDVLQELDNVLEHYNSLDTKTKRVWDRIKWDPEKFKTLRSRLVASVSMLNVFYTSMLHDSQVLILEALGRLEQDYRGGHREESIASLEKITSAADEDDEDEDAAWTQILRDLEDVGIAKQHALSYRDMIIDWLVTAVNEGRLLEQQPDTLPSMSQLDAALPMLEIAENAPHHLDGSNIQNSQSGVLSPFSALEPTYTKDDTKDDRANPISATASLPVPRPYSNSSSAASFASETDTSSLYPGPLKLYTKGVKPMYNDDSNQTPNARRAAAPDATTRTSLNTVAVQSPSEAPIPVPVPPTPTAPLISVDAPTNTTLSAPVTFHPAVQDSHTGPLSSYYEKESLQAVDLTWNSQQIIAAWARHDFSVAEKHLEDHLLAVERGVTVPATGTQPDRRVLRHLLGVAASFAGNFGKAKRYFESVFNGIYLNRANLDDGDIAAARWLGDACLHLHEHHNAVLAWAVAFEGSLGRYGTTNDRTVRISEELRSLEHSLFAFRRIKNSFLDNRDPTDIFRQTHAVEKNSLISIVETELYGVDGNSSDSGRSPPNSDLTSGFNAKPRPKVEMMPSEGFLLNPLISFSVWPMPWDATFSPTDSVQLDRYMHSFRFAKINTPLIERSLPTMALGASKELHFVTRRGSQWLIERVKNALQEMCIEFSEHANAATIVCCRSQHRDGYAFLEGLEIRFKKLQFRNVHGLKITEVIWATRKIGSVKGELKDFRDVLKSILERAEEEAVNVSKGTSQELPNSTIYEVR